MATWKSNKIPVTLDLYDDYAKGESYWEYQTCADVFSFYQILSEDKYGYINRKAGDKIESILIGPDTAKQLYHALSQWMRNYNSEKEQLEAITNNMFDVKE